MLGKNLLTMPWFLFLLSVLLFVVSEHLNMDVNVRRNRFGIIPLYWISCFCGIFVILNISSWLDKCTTTIGFVIKYILCYWGRESLVFLIFNELMLFCAGILLRIVGVPYELIASNVIIHLVIVVIAMILLSVSAYLANKKPLKYLFGKR